MTAPGDLHEIMHRASAVLLDFDGPVCDVFANYPAHIIADELRAILRSQEVAVPTSVDATSDPLQLIEWVAREAAEHQTLLEEALTARELAAAIEAIPTPGSTRLLQQLDATGRLVAIVSNNSARAIEAYLEKHSIGNLVRHIQGRDAGDPKLMKPNPDPVHKALYKLGTLPRSAVFVGDSASDLAAARAAGVRMIAFANKPGKLERFFDADATILSVELLADVVECT